jgi:hypothetical protein
MPRKVLVTSTKCLVSLSLSFLLGVPDVARAAPQAPAPAKLNIVIVEGEGAINNIRQRTAREPIVQVEDENHRPVAGAAVLFLLPENGAGGTFANGARSLTVTTDSQGRAVAKGLRVNDAKGKFQIQVEASYMGLSAAATITQTNAVITASAAGGGISSGKLIGILAAVGGAAAVGIVVATRGGGGGGTSTPTPTPTTISAGTPTVGH